MKIHIRIPLLIAALSLVSCERYDVPTGHARVNRFNSPAPVVATPTPAPKPEPKPIVAQQQPVAAKPVPATPAPVAAPLPPKPEVVAPAPKPEVVPPAPKLEVKKPEPRPIVSQQQPKPRADWQSSAYNAPTRKARLPIAPTQRQKRQYPLMPGQNRGLKARGY